MKTTLDIAGKTDPGCVRDRNEDSIALEPGLGLLVVADGMGGHNSGEVASQLAVETILEYARKMLGGPRLIVPEEGDHKKPVRVRQLEYFISLANTLIYEKARAFPKDHGMGTTVVAVLLDGKTATVGHVGDSRLYLHRSGALQALTEDHSLVMEQVRRGLITREQADRSNLQNILTRALGTEEKVAADVQEHPLFPGDVLLLCSDGLTKMVSESEIARTLAQAASSAEATDRLIEMARSGGGVDNVTVAVVRVVGAGGGLKGLLSRFAGRRG